MSEKTSNDSGDKKRLRSIEDELESDEVMASSSSTVDESVDPLATEQPAAKKKKIDPYTVATEAVEKTFGTKDGRETCNPELYSCIYKQKHVDWDQWKTVKKVLCQNVNVAYRKKIDLKNGEEITFPKREHAKAVRIELDRVWPKFFAFGKLWDIQSHQGPYDLYKERCKVHHDWRDAMYWSIEAHLGHVTGKMKKGDDVPEMPKPSFNNPTQNSFDGQKELNEWGLHCLHRLPVASEHSAFKDLVGMYSKDPEGVHLKTNALKKLKESTLVTIQKFSTDEKISDVFQECRYLQNTKLYMLYCGDLFDHRVSMEHYMKRILLDAKPVIKALLEEEEMFEKFSETFLEDLEVHIDDFQYVVEGLSMLMKEGCYLRSAYEASGDQELKLDAAQREDPIVWYKIDKDSYSVVIESEVVLNFSTYLESFVCYITSFSTFNVSWNHRIQITKKGKKRVAKPMKNHYTLDFIHCMFLTKKVDFRNLIFSKPVKDMCLKFYQVEKKINENY